MQLLTKSDTNVQKKQIFQLILDESNIYLEESLGSIMVRGEVIVNFSKDTLVQGPIELAFEGIQRCHPWAGIMIPSTIETKLNVTELSLLLPNPQGLMPAGIQRFPFEFPIPTSLPATISIQDRLDIFYQLTASIRRSGKNWIDSTGYKKKITAKAPMRIVGSLESVTKKRTRRGIDFHGLDEQYDLLAFSLAGRSLENLTHCTEPLEGIRYKIGIDRTAIALGTSIGVDVMIQPTLKDAIVKSIMVKVSEKRDYFVKVPAGYTWGVRLPETKHHTEKKTVVLKWAYGHPLSKNKLIGKGDKFIHQYEVRDPYPRNSNASHSDKKPCSISEKAENHDKGLVASDTVTVSPKGTLINLKELDQHVCLGEYFNGSFVMPAPDCSNILRPSMDYESIRIQHWVQLVVKVECNGKTFDLSLESPGYVLDCRLVNNDEQQTLLPSPPPYDTDETQKYNKKNWRQSTFWEQREPITLASGWGSPVPCPCESRKLKLHKIDTANENPLYTDNGCLSLISPTYGSPPSYSVI